MFINQALLPGGMRNLSILNSREKKHLVAILKDQYGYTGDLPFVVLKNRKNKLYIVNREIERLTLEDHRVDSYGLYIGELYNSQVRLSIEGAQLIGPHASKNIVELEGEQFEQWMKRFNIPWEEDPGQGFLIVKHKNDFIGCGKFANGAIHNYVSKSRALQVVNT